MSAPEAASFASETTALQTTTLSGLFRWCLVALTPLCLVFATTYVLRRESSALVLTLTFGALQLSVLYLQRLLKTRGPGPTQRLFLIAASIVVAIYLVLAPDLIMLVGVMGIFFFIRVTMAFDRPNALMLGLAWVLMFVAAILVRTYAGFTPLHLASAETAVVIGLPVAVTVLFATVDGYVTRTIDELIARNEQRRAALATTNAELGRTNDELRTIGYALSHDLLVPLGNVKGFVSELRRDITTLDGIVRTARFDDGAQASAADGLLGRSMPEALTFIDASADRMDALVSSILQMARAGHRDLQIESVDAATVVNDALATLKQRIARKDVRIDVGALPVVEADALALIQIFTNLFVNAIAYLDPERPGHIRVSSSLEDGHVRFAVSDNGRGIGADDLEAIFELFRRSGPRTQPGSGIGLAGVDTLVRRLGGRVWCESTPGTGSTFYFTLPTPRAGATQSTPPRGTVGALVISGGAHAR